MTVGGKYDQIKQEKFKQEQYSIKYAAVRALCQKYAEKRLKRGQQTADLMSSGRPFHSGGAVTAECSDLQLRLRNALKSSA